MSGRYPPALSVTPDRRHDMNLRRLFHRQTDDEWSEEWHRVHRWDVLADYNGRVVKGIVHTPEYAAVMAEQQRMFNGEHYGSPDSRQDLFPRRLEPGESMTVTAPL